MIRAKFIVRSITQFNYDSDAREVVLVAQYDDTIEEDRRFEEATPTGNLTMMVRNPKALNELLIGREFYLDFTPVPADVAETS